MITRTTHVIAVADLEVSCAFYRDVLGFEVRDLGGGEDGGWRMFVKDSCQIMAGECPDALLARDTGDHSYFAYFVVDDVDPYYARVMAAGTEIVKPLRSEPWRMREFGLRTVDGHRIMIGQQL
jgi:predicted enzyme related to lactoylglutathione lyase